jgi:hypothetical protein
MLSIDSTLASLQPFTPIVLPVRPVWFRHFRLSSILKKRIHWLGTSTCSEESFLQHRYALLVC